MARIIECDRCQRRLNDESEVFRVSFSPMPKGVSNTTTAYELCERCIDHVNWETKTAPVQVGKF